VLLSSGLSQLAYEHLFFRADLSQEGRPKRPDRPCRGSR
jgi:hypothetical protein